MSRPLVSVVTPTWGRHDLLIGAIDNVRAQTYRPLQHVVVSDGPDPELMARILENVKENIEPHEGFGVCPLALGRRWSLELRDSHAAAPMAVAQLVAAGEIQAWLSDDERMLEPTYLAEMVDVLRDREVDFVYPRVRLTWLNQPGREMDIGSDPPQFGQITHIVYRASMIDKAGGPYRSHTDQPGDWEFISRAMRGDASWAYVPRVLFTHRVDR